MDTDLGPLTLDTLVDYIRITMELAEEAIQAGDKAAYAQEMILRLIAESDITDTEKELCRTIVRTGVLKNIFTLVVDATKGKINIKNNIQIMNVEETDLSLGTSKQKGLRFVFEFKSVYDPKIGSITLIGEVIFLEQPFLRTNLFLGKRLLVLALVDFRKGSSGGKVYLG